MTSYIALLRGINLGRNRKVGMADLREVARSIGHADARTWIQSGNLLFSSPRRNAEQLALELERVIADRLRIPVRVLVRSREELAEVVEKNPLPEAAADPSRFYAVFLERDPSPKVVAAIDPSDFEPDQVRFGHRVIYAWYRGGLRESKLAAALADARLGVTTTARNWNTTTRLVELAGDETPG